MRERRRGAGSLASVCIAIGISFSILNRLTVLKDSLPLTLVVLEILSYKLSEVVPTRLPLSPRTVKFLISHRQAVEQGLQDIAALLPAVLLGWYMTDEVARPQGRA